MAPEVQGQAQAGPSREADKEKKEGGHKERLGNYHVREEIGRGSFATVYRGYRSKTHVPVAIKAVSRQKLTSKLLENLESEINILKVIHHRNIVALMDCFKTDAQVYLVMEYCSGSDLSVYIKNRGRTPSLDFVPRASVTGEKVFWDHGSSGGIDERVTRCFLGQLSQALMFLRSQNLMHRDIKPQNLLMQPPTESELAEGHPLGIPVLKVADFGFARILPAAAMAETLCGSPLYMAPEILRYEKYDAKADLWSVGAVLFEMAVGKPPFRANNHVELLRRIEKGEDRIKFPDESSRAPEEVATSPVSPDIKALIRALLKRKPAGRMSFEEFFACGVWEGFMTESFDEGEGSMSYETSTGSVDSDQRIKDMVASQARSKERLAFAPQPIAADPALNPQPATISARPRLPLTQPVPEPETEPEAKPVIRRSEPKYYVSDEGDEADKPQPTPGPRPIVTRSNSNRAQPGSIEDPPIITPTYNAPIPQRRVTEGSPLASTPPINRVELTGKDESALAGSDSMLGREYVVVEKGQVEINKLADELEQASKKPSTMTRRPSSRISVVSRPVSAFRLSPTNTQPAAIPQQALVPVSYSPPFALSSTPPFAIPPTSQRQASHQLPGLSAQTQVTIFPPTSSDQYAKYGSSPSSHGALARALTHTAMRIVATSANSAATALVRAASRRRPVVYRTSDIDAEEDELLSRLEDVARKAFVLFELADQKLHVWQHLARTLQTSPAGSVSEQRRKSSSGSSANGELHILRQQEASAGEAMMLYAKAMGFMSLGTGWITDFVHAREEERGWAASSELVEMSSWLRHRFNECLEKVHWARERCAEELPFVEHIVHDKARESSRQAALLELQGEYAAAEVGYENALWLLQALLDDGFYESGRVRDEDRAGLEKLMITVNTRLEAMRRKMAGTAISA